MDKLKLKTRVEAKRIRPSDFFTLSFSMRDGTRIWHLGDRVEHYRGDPLRIAFDIEGNSALNTSMMSGFADP